MKYLVVSRLHFFNVLNFVKTFLVTIFAKSEGFCSFSIQINNWESFDIIL